MVSFGRASSTWTRSALRLCSARTSVTFAVDDARGGSGRASTPTPAVRQPDAAPSARSASVTRRNTCMNADLPGRAWAPARIAWSLVGAILDQERNRDGRAEVIPNLPDGQARSRRTLRDSIPLQSVSVNTLFSHRIGFPVGSALEKLRQR